MTWNYRAVKTEKGYGIYEVYYDKTGKPEGRTPEPIFDFYCETLEELIAEIDMIKGDLKQTPLHEKDI